jgi:hypothetical protein
MKEFLEFLTVVLMLEQHYIMDIATKWQLLVVHYMDINSTLKMGIA